jgi:NADPH-dependent 2,4-dienoyl-CoA reductase/sulfur reductase-like enzyme
VDIAGINFPALFAGCVFQAMFARRLTRVAVCEDAAHDGFDFVEAYPNKEFVDEQMDFMGISSCTEKTVLSCTMNTRN